MGIIVILLSLYPLSQGIYYQYKLSSVTNNIDETKLTEKQKMQLEIIRKMKQANIYYIISGACLLIPGTCFILYSIVNKNKNP